MDKKDLLKLVDDILQKYNSPNITSERIQKFIRIFKIIKYPEEYIPKEDKWCALGFTGDHGIIHRIPNKGYEWENLVYLKHIIISFIYSMNDYGLIFQTEFKSDQDIEFIIRQIDDKQLLKGYATTLRNSDNKFKSRKVLNKLIHCDDKEKDIPKQFREGKNIFRGDWDTDKIINAQDILIDTFIENKHLYPILKDGIVKASYEQRLKDKYFKTLSKLLRLQTVKNGHIKTLLNMNSNWKKVMYDLDQIESLDDVNFDLYDIITKSQAYGWILDAINKRWTFKNNRGVQSDLKDIDKERKKKKAGYSMERDGIRRISEWDPNFKSSLEK